MGMADYGKIGAFVIDRVNQVSNWLKGKNRRKDVQTMDNALSTDNNNVINDKLSKLKNKVKNREDSR